MMLCSHALPLALNQHGFLCSTIRNNKQNHQDNVLFFSCLYGWGEKGQGGGVERRRGGGGAN